jgi:DNA-binding LytR/AlgR family response regulator
MKILIVEDEVVAARMLKKMIIQHLGDRVESIQIQSSLIGSQCYIWEHPIDLLFLDLDLDGDDGFNLLKEAVAGSFHTIIISAHVNRAVEAFEYGVLDFIPKPCSDERLKTTINRYNASFPNNGIKFLAVVRESQVTLIHLEHIIYFEADNKKVKIFRKDGEVLIHNKMLQNLEMILPPRFIRIHRSYIINLHEIRSIDIQPNHAYTLMLKNGNRLPVSRSAYQTLKKRMEDMSF